MAQSATSEMTAYHLRMPTELHAAIQALAEDAGMSMNTWMIRRLSAVVALTGNDGAVSEVPNSVFHATVDFALSGVGADDQAYRVVDQIVNIAELAGGADVTATLSRTVPMPARSSWAS